MRIRLMADIKKLAVIDGQKQYTYYDKQRWDITYTLNVLNGNI